MRAHSPAAASVRFIDFQFVNDVAATLPWDAPAPARNAAKTPENAAFATFGEGTRAVAQIAVKGGFSRRESIRDLEN